MLPIDTHFKVEMVPCAAAGTANGTDLLPFGNRLASTDINGRHMGVKGANGISMINHNVLTIRISKTFHQDDRTGICGQYGRSLGSCNVNSRMELARRGSRNPRSQFPAMDKGQRIEPVPV